MQSDSGHSQQLLKIKSVCELTGFSPTLLRAWERRYQFLEPNRQPSGHRMYTQDDLKVLRRVREMMDLGHTVGEISALGRDTLLNLDPVASDSTGARENSERAERARSLAPTDLSVHRSARYRGEGLGISLRELDPFEVACVYRLYQIVKRAHELWLYMDPESRNERLVLDHLQGLLEESFLSDVARLGIPERADASLRNAALADARWGALGPLLEALRSLGPTPSPEEIQGVVLLARDHAKILRNAFPDIDAPLRSADESTKAHGIRGMVDKIIGVYGNVEVFLDWQGSVSSRCLETSTVDRIVYDFLRRIQATHPERVWVYVGAVNASLVRWAFRFDKPDIAPHLAGDLAAIAVGQSVGLNPSAALSQGYLGQADGWAWFHWPIFVPPTGATICECDV